MSLNKKTVKMLNEEFDWAAYKNKVVQERVKQYNTIENAVVEMDAVIQSLKVQIKALNEMIDWDAIDMSDLDED
jgi:hypothetical protein